VAETINGLHKAEVIHRTGPSRSVAAFEYAMLECVACFKLRRVFEPIGDILHADTEERNHAMINPSDIAA
jgi:hypothetical protein